MTNTISHLLRSGALAAVCCLATLAPTASNEAAAQVIQFRTITPTYYYGYGGTYSNGYGYSAYGAQPYGYSGYGNGPYGYRSSAPYGYAYTPSSSYGYGNTPSYQLYYRGSRYYGGTYGESYSNPRFYSPYGYGR